MLGCVSGQWDSAASGLWAASFFLLATAAVQERPGHQNRAAAQEHRHDTLQQSTVSPPRFRRRSSPACCDGSHALLRTHPLRHVYFVTYLMLSVDGRRLTLPLTHGRHHHICYQTSYITKLKNHYCIHCCCCSAAACCIYVQQKPADLSVT